MKKAIRVVLFIFAAGCIGFTVLIVALNIVFPANDFIDPDNHVIDKYDKYGKLIRHEVMVDGKLNGYFFLCETGRIIQGHYDHGIKVGNWECRYKCGKIRTESLYSNCISVSNQCGFVTRNSTLIYRNDYNLAGGLVGKITNGVGTAVEMCDDGVQLAYFIMDGYPTNYVVFYYASPSDPYSQGQIMTIRIEGPRLFECAVGRTGQINFIEDAGSRAFRRGKMGLILDDPERIPPFLLGEIHYVIPSIVNACPVFDTRISCSNATLVVEKMSCPEHAD